MGDLSFAWSMRNRGRWSRTAVCSSTGILTRPKASEPFHKARAMQWGRATGAPAVGKMVLRQRRADKLCDRGQRGLCRVKPEAEVVVVVGGEHVSGLVPLRIP